MEPPIVDFGAAAVSFREITTNDAEKHHSYLTRLDRVIPSVG